MNDDPRVLTINAALAARIFNEVPTPTGTVGLTAYDNSTELATQMENLSAIGIVDIVEPYWDRDVAALLEPKGLSQKTSLIGTKVFANARYSSIVANLCFFNWLDALFWEWLSLLLWPILAVDGTLVALLPFDLDISGSITSFIRRNALYNNEVDQLFTVEIIGITGSAAYYAREDGVAPDIQILRIKKGV